ncbi:MAG: ATP-binding protein [Chloroflexi bacterium]|nr:ATP-binding protein [Chloroflexota bacterium]
MHLSPHRPDASPFAATGGAALLVMVGAPGSGKSFLARRLAAALAADLVQTDVVRKEMFPQPRYTTSEASAVYAECHRRIAQLLERGHRVIFDGTNLRERRRRLLYALGEERGAVVIPVAAYAPVAAVRERLAQRASARDPQDRSDADWGIYRRLARDAQPIVYPHIVANTTVDPAPLIRLLRRLLAGAARRTHHERVDSPSSPERGLG